MGSPLRVPVLVDREEYDAFKTYSELTGIPVSRLVRDAMKDYREVTLAARIEALTGLTATCTLPEPELPEPVCIDTSNNFARA